MYFTSKLKPPNLFIDIMIGLIIGVPFIMVMIITNDISRGFKVVFPFFVIGCLVGPWLYYRTGNRGYLVYMLFFMVLTIMAITIGFFDPDKNKIFLSIVAILAIIFTFWLYYLIFQRRLKFRTREIMELAALQVEAGEESYTGRPLPVAKAEYSKEQLLDFAKFLNKNLIAIPYVEDDRVVFLFDTSYGKVYGFNRHYQSHTWVSFDYDGNVVVNFGMKDYLNYKEDMTFDQLCGSLGKLMIDFFELFKNGKEIRIIDQLNSLKLNPMT
jgi:hypothetical protein